PGRPDRARRKADNLLQSFQAADGGLHYREVRLMPTQPHDHIVRSFDEERTRLVDEILRMGEMAASQLEAAIDVVERRDDGAARRVIDNDVAIDALEKKISEEVMELALRGPLARDLREI